MGLFLLALIACNGENTGEELGEFFDVDFGF